MIMFIDVSTKVNDQQGQPQDSKQPQEGSPDEASGYNRDAEKDQEIGDEFLNPDEKMTQAAQTIQVKWKYMNQRNTHQVNKKAGDGSTQQNAN